MYDNFLFRKSWWNIIKNLPAGQRSEVIDLVTQYMFEDMEPQFDEMTAVSIAVQFILRDINADKERYDNITEQRREAGRKGGMQRAANFQANQANEANQANATLLENETKQTTKQNQAPKQTKRIDICIDKDIDNTLSPSSLPAGEGGEEREREKTEVVFAYSLHLLSQGRPNAYSEAEQAYDYNEALGWVKETDRKNGDIVRQHIRDKLAWLKSRPPKSEQVFAPADGQTMAAILAKTGCKNQNRGVINDFRGLRFIEDKAVFIYSSFLFSPLYNAIQKNQKTNDIVFAELRKRAPKIQCIDFQLK